MEQQVWTTLKVLSWTSDYLATKGVENARREAEWLLCAATGLDRVGLYLNFDKPLNDQELASYRQMTTRRARREPLQHILGTQEFSGLELAVSADVLIPRYDTEVLLECACAGSRLPESILDVGTGSGCLAIALQKRYPQAKMTAVDISRAALEVAARNAVTHACDIEFVCGDLFEPLKGRKFDLIVSNPPYIPSADIEELEPEVRLYDPRTALDGGSDGLDLYRRIVPQALDLLNNDGALFVEIGIGQDPAVVELFEAAHGYEATHTAKDSQGIVRVVGARKRR